MTWARLKVFLLISAATRCHCVDEKRLFFPLFQLFFPFDLIKYDFQKDEPIRNKHGWCEKVKRGKYVLQCITMVMQTLPGSFFFKRPYYWDTVWYQHKLLIFNSNKSNTNFDVRQTLLSTAVLTLKELRKSLDIFTEEQCGKMTVWYGL